jgi:hypothetical protein
MTKSDWYRHPEYGIVFGNEVFTTPVVRLAYPSLKTPKAPPPPKPGQSQGAPSYEATLLFTKTNPEHVAWTKFAEGLEVYNERTSAPLAALKPCKDGDDAYWQTGEKADKYPFYKNQYLVAARNTDKPGIVGPDAEPCDPSLLHGGCLVQCIVTLRVTSKGASYKLRAIQLIKDDGVNYGGGAKSSDDYVKMLKAKMPVAEANPFEDDAVEAPVEEATPEVEDAPDAELPAAPKKVLVAPGKKKLGKQAVADIL